MNISGYVHMQFIHKDRVYYFCMPVGASYQDAFEAAQIMAAGVQEMAKRAEETHQKLQEEAAANVAENEAVDATESASAEAAV